MLFYILFELQSELCTLGSRPGMECMPLRSSPGAYHYHVTDQTKSLQVNIKFIWMIFLAKILILHSMISERVDRVDYDSIAD